MFLASLSYKQRKVFLGLAKEILQVDDGVMDNYEEDYLRSLCSEMSLSLEIRPFQVIPPAQTFWPIFFLRSRTRVENPCLAVISAHDRPAGPAPTIMTS